MPTIPIHNLGSVGIVTDIPAYELPPEAWTSGGNVRFKDGKVQKCLGHNTIFDPPSIAPLWIHPIYQATQAFWVYAGLTKVYVTDMASHFNITRQTAGVDVDYAATADFKWNGGSLNGLGIFNNGVDPPQMWNPANTSTRLTALTNWPASTTARVIRPAFKYFLIALDVTESGTRYPTVLRWSHPAAPGAVPSSWDYTNPALDAGRTVLADTSGFLLDFAMLGQTGILYKEDSVYIMNYVGGRSIFDIDSLYPDIGLFARECVKPFRGGHFMVTADDIVIHTAGTPRSILTGRQRTTLFGTIDTTFKSRSFVVVNQPKSEVWFCYPETGYSQPNKALIWNWDNGTLGTRELGGSVAFGAFGVINPGAVNQTWDADTGIWDNDSSIWDSRDYDPTNTNVLLARNDVARFLHVDQSNQFSGSNYTSFIERRGLAIIGKDRQGNPKVDRNAIKYVKMITPHVTGPVQVMVGSHTTPDGAITWDGPYSFDPAIDREIPVNVVGPYIAVRVQSTTNGLWEFVNYSLQLEVIGRY